MIPPSARHKGFHPLLPALLALLAACASSPTPPDQTNHAPQITDILISGDKPVVAAGAVNVLLQAVTADQDGDALTLTWSGPGSFHNKDDQAKTVRWDVPAAQYGSLTVTCAASDGEASGSRNESFEVGRALTAIDYGELVGNQITWSTQDAPFYILKTDVEIPTGVTLRVEAGTTVWCDEARRLSISGSLVVAGTAGHAVEFKAYTAATAVQDYWEGIYFASSAGLLQMDHCSMANASLAVSSELGTGTGVHLGNCLFIACKKPLAAGFGPLEVLGCRMESFSQAVTIDHCEISLRNCTFTLGTTQALLLRSFTTGECSDNIFENAGTPAISISGGSYTQIHGNRFFGTGLAMTVGGGYGASPEPLDARCNWWGDGVGSAQIAARISSQGADPAPVVFTPWKSTLSADCGVDPPVLLQGIHVVFDARHPLFAAPPGGIDLSVMADDGFPRLLEVEVMDPGDGFVNDYAWSASAGGSLFVAATDWPPGGPDTEPYPAQTDSPGGSAIFFVPAGAAGESVSVTITDHWDQNLEDSADFSY